MRCAVEVQRGMAERNVAVPAAERIEFRIGINLGDVIVEDGDIFGDGVNIAARLEGLAEPGGVLISNNVHDQVRDRLPFAFTDLGDQQVKNIARPVRVYRVTGRRQQPVPEPAALPLPDKPSIAVLPFQNMSGDPEQEYFADGMVEDIITATVARFRWLFVIARNSSFTYKGQGGRCEAGGARAGRALRARRQRAQGRQPGAHHRQLIDAATGATSGPTAIDGALDDIFELQDQVASSVVGAIEPKLRQSEIERAARKPTASLDAYDLYLRALAGTTNQPSRCEAGGHLPPPALPPPSPLFPGGRRVGR